MIKALFVIIVYLSNLLVYSSIDNSNKFKNIAYLQNLSDDLTSSSILDSLHSENLILKEETLKTIAKIENRNILVIVVSLFSFVALLLAYLLYKSTKTTRKNNRILKLQNLEINKQKKELEELNNLKTKFFSVISHDLRGPLLSLKGILNLMDDNLLEKEELDEITNKLKMQLSVNTNLLDNLLIWSKSQMQGEKLKKINFDIHKVIEENLKLYEANIYTKNIKINIQSPGPFEIYADREMVNVIVRNIIGNAIKFTPTSGEISIHYKILENEKFRIGIRNSGVPISKIEIEEIMKQNFYSTQALNHEKGTGLGLILCHEFIKKNNGTFELESSNKKGNTFFFTLPMFKEKS